MAEEGKKISFGFSKVIKKTALKNVVPVEEKKVDYIDCVDDKSIKIIGGEEIKDEPLVIPMLGSKTWHERIINKIDSDVFEPKNPEPDIKAEPIEDVQIKQEPVDQISNGVASEQNVQPMEISEIKQEPNAEQPLTLEEQAAQEIIADLSSTDDKNKEQNTFAVPIANDDLRGKEESTLEDYDSIPIDQFGMAMLRGMGWQPGKGIGKNEKVVPPKIPELRPKGMGLGADKLLLKKSKENSTKANETLSLNKGSYVKIIAGKESGSYGTVEGLDEESARIYVKLALGGEVITMNELWAQPVTATEYSQNSKVLNVKKYEEYKNKKASNKQLDQRPSKSEEDTDSEDYKSKRSEKSKKKSKKKKYYSSDDESSPERKSKKRKDTSDSEDDSDKYKKSKKLKKHKSRDSSSERSSRKNRKKDKEREKSRHKKSDYSDPSERARHKNRKKSRSRSYSPKSRRRARSRSYSPRR